jgi:hypothetical protein
VIVVGFARVLEPPPVRDEHRIGWLGVFASPAVECAFRAQRVRDDLWLMRFLVAAGMLRVALLMLADYGHFDVGSAFWLLISGRFLFLLVSACVLVRLRRVVSAAMADRLFLGWSFFIIAMTAGALAARPASNPSLLFMSFGMVLVTYCVTPLTLARQAILALTYSAAALYAARAADAATVTIVAAAHAMCHVFGAVTSWWANHRRRETYLAALREAELRASLEAAMAEVKTLRGLLHICAWCKRVRDEAEDWETVERYVQAHTHALFTHGICPDCFQSQVDALARLRR